MKFYNNSSSANSNITFTSSGNIGIGTSPPSSRLTINSNGWASIGNPNPSSILHVYSEHHEEVEKRFFEAATLLARKTNISSEGLRNIHKGLNEIGYSNEEVISSISKIEKMLSDIGCSRSLRICVVDVFVFHATHMVKNQREIDSIQIFEPLDV